MLKNVSVNWNLGFQDVCKKKQVIIAYNNDPNIFWVWLGDMFEWVNKFQMVKYQLKPFMRYGSMARQWEIQTAFFENNNIEPKWINANYNWGTLNYTTGQWSGAVGMIQRDEADYAICCFTGTYGRSKVAAFSPGIDYLPLHWLTRYPLELPPTWNLLGLFTKGYISQMRFLKT